MSSVKKKNCPVICASYDMFRKIQEGKKGIFDAQQSKKYPRE